MLEDIVPGLLLNENAGGLLFQKQPTHSRFSLDVLKLSEVHGHLQPSIGGFVLGLLANLKSKPRNPKGHSAKARWSGRADCCIGMFGAADEPIRISWGSSKWNSGRGCATA
jgi:hypothetical protein